MRFAEYCSRQQDWRSAQYVIQANIIFEKTWQNYKIGLFKYRINKYSARFESFFFIFVLKTYFYF